MKRIGAISSLVVITAVVIGLVFLSSGPAAWATSNQSPAAQTVPTPAGGAVAQVTPNASATAKTADGKTEISIPEGAVTTPIEVAVTPKTVADIPATPPAQTAIVGVFTIEAFKGGELQSGFVFSKAITICTKVTQADMDKVKGDVTKIRIMRFADDTKQWIALTTSVDPPVAGSPACATVRSLSTFALAVTGQVAPTPTPTPKLPVGDIYLSGPTTWWVGLAVLGLFLILFGGLAIRRNTNKRNV